MPTGKVKWFNDEKGYGFIEVSGGEDVFVHHTGIRMDGHRTLTEGADVQFEVTQDVKGARAINVVRLGAPESAKVALPVYNVTGVVTKWLLDDGFGFCQVEGVGSVYFNTSCLANCADEDRVSAGCKLTLDVFPPPGQQPRPVGRDVRLTDSAPEPYFARQRESAGVLAPASCQTEAQRIVATVVTVDDATETGKIEVKGYGELDFCLADLGNLVSFWEITHGDEILVDVVRIDDVLKIANCEWAN